jgi:hypothetical protein
MRSLDRLARFENRRHTLSYDLTESQESNSAKHATSQSDYLYVAKPLNMLPVGYVAHSSMMPPPPPPPPPPPQTTQYPVEISSVDAMQYAYHQFQQSAYPASFFHYAQCVQQMPPQQDIMFSQQGAMYAPPPQQQQQQQQEKQPLLSELSIQDYMYQVQCHQQMQLAQEYQYHQAHLIQQQQMTFYQYVESPHHQQLHVVTPPSLSPSHATAGTNNNNNNAQFMPGGNNLIPTHADPSYLNRHLRHEWTY